MNWWQLLLYPLAILYDFVTRARNYLFDKNIIKPIEFDTNVIAVGNLSAGGTGKTPFVHYLIEYFQKRGLAVSTLSRGYGRSTWDFRRVGPGDTAHTVGDEPLMVSQRYPDAGVFVGTERELAIPQVLFHKEDTQVVLLDDAFQHRTVLPRFSVLLTSCRRPFYHDWLLPSGRLRECRRGAVRADCVVLTKCPDSFTGAMQARTRDLIGKYTDAPVFFSTIVYGEPIPIFSEGKPLCRRVVGISGIAEPAPFEEHLQKNHACKIIHHYGDHHRYSKLDIRHITNELDENTSLIVTEKDKVKLEGFEELRQYSCFYIPIQVRFLKDETLFHSLIDSALKKDAFEKDRL